MFPCSDEEKMLPIGISSPLGDQHAADLLSCGCCRSACRRVGCLRASDHRIAQQCRNWATEVTSWDLPEDQLREPACDLSLLTVYIYGHNQLSQLGLCFCRHCVNVFLCYFRPSGDRWGFGGPGDYQGASLYWPATETSPGSTSPTPRLDSTWPARFGL